MTTPNERLSGDAEAAAGAIHLELDLPHAPEKVWRALTDPALVSRWLLPASDFTLAVGAPFTFTTDPHPGWDGTINCRMLEVELLRVLRYTWVVHDDRGIDTVVTFSLQPTASGTHLSIAHTGFQLPAHHGALKGTRYGWSLMTGRLVSSLSSA
ncbi:SRPBCC domain-containing protein [Gemmatimonas sp.]|uniref:SRPBCC family protein n=1 Tax=Gemmatimonas sp. TaxID=1962908 RepID=UPI00286D0E70|nr:SRPBCC domain-containing protein [Gemmatimonas sp.]